MSLPKSQISRRHYKGKKCTGSNALEKAESHRRLEGLSDHNAGLTLCGREWKRSWTEMKCYEFLPWERLSGQSYLSKRPTGNMEKQEFIGMGHFLRTWYLKPLQVPRDRANSLLGCFVEAWKRVGTALSGVGMAELTWHMMEEGIKELREVGMLEWMNYVRLEDPLEIHRPQEGWRQLFAKTH